MVRDIIWVILGTIYALQWFLPKEMIHSAISCWLGWLQSIGNPPQTVYPIWPIAKTNQPVFTRGRGTRYWLTAMWLRLSIPVFCCMMVSTERCIANCTLQLRQLLINSSLFAPILVAFATIDQYEQWWISHAVLTVTINPKGPRPKPATSNHCVINHEMPVFNHKISIVNNSLTIM